MQQNLSELNTSELAVLESLHASKKGVSQRDLAVSTGLSLGLINAVIKKLVQTGYVKTSHLDKRSLEYLLTPQGFAHAATRSYHYIVNTMKRYHRIQSQLKTIVDNLTSMGLNDFYLYGDGELADLVATFFNSNANKELKRKLPKRKNGSEVILNANLAPLPHKDCHVIDLVRELGNGMEFDFQNWLSNVTVSEK